MILKIRNICAVFILLIFNWSNFNKHLSSFKNLRKISHSYGRNFQILNSTKYFLKTIDKKRPRRSVVYKMVAMTGLEPVTPALWVRCSNQLSYIAKKLWAHYLNFHYIRQAYFSKNLGSGPISWVLSKTIIPLGVQSLIRSSDLPESDAGHT